MDLPGGADSPRRRPRGPRGIGGAGLRGGGTAARGCLLLVSAALAVLLLLVAQWLDEHVGAVVEITRVGHHEERNELILQVRQSLVVADEEAACDGGCPHIERAADVPLVEGLAVVFGDGLPVVGQQYVLI